MPHVASLEQLVLQHRAERWRDAHRELERHGVAPEPLKHVQEWDVRFGDRLEEPIFFEKLLVLRVPNEWQMCVENEREVAGSNC